MPQLELAGYSPQIVWLIITFVILWLLMAKVALPRIGVVLEERQRKIDDNLDMAENFRSEAQGELKKYEKAISEARENARTVISEAARQTAQDSTTRHSELSDSLANQVMEAEASIISAKEDSIANIRDSAAEVATVAAERLIGMTLPAETVVAAINQVLNRESQ